MGGAVAAPTAPVNGAEAAFSDTSGLSTDVDTLMPTVATRSGAVSDNIPTAPVAPTSGSAPGVVSTFMSKIGSIFSESANIAGDVAKWVGKEAVTAVEAPIKLGIDAVDFGKDEYDYVSAQHNMDSLSQQSTNLMNSWKSGKITTAKYTTASKQLSNDYMAANKRFTQSWEKQDALQKNVVSDYTNTMGDILTVLTAGIINPAETASADVGTSAAIKFFTGEGSDMADFLSSSATKIDGIMSKIPGISDNGATNLLSRQFLKNTADTVSDAAAGEGLGSYKIGKAVAVALVLRRPIVFNYFVGQGQKVYDSLSEGKYGSALERVGLNSAMVLSGGPIGWAFSHISDAAKAGLDRVFGQTSFMDELSTRIGDGNAQGLYNELSKPENTEMAKAFKAMEVTNLQKTGGDVVAAVDNIVSSYDGANLALMQEMTHAQVAKDMFDTYNDQQAVVADLIKGGMAKEEAARAVVGRWTVEDNNKLQAIIGKADEKVNEANFEQSGYTSLLDARAATRRAAIQALQDSKGRNAAWLNNDYLQQQIDQIITKYEDTNKATEAIRDIDTGTASDVSPKVKAMLRDHGHVAIVPEKNATPYIPYDSLAPGKNKLVSAFATGSEEGGYFKAAAQPLPVLGSIGKLLTNVGLSPEDAGNAVQKSLNQNLTEQLAGVKGISSEDPEAGQKLLDTISDYVKNPTASFLKAHNIPVTDYRQLTLNDIKQALNTDVQTAKEVRNALMTAMIKVPLDIRGLGDRIMDLNYKYNPMAKYYARIQGATRYVFNPFFNWQKTTQTEFLAQFEAGGKTLTYGPIGGVLRMLMPGRYDEIDNTIAMLNEKGILGSTRGEALAIGRLGEGDYDQAVGKVGTKLLKGEQQSLASLLMVMSDKAGMSPSEFVDSHYDESVDALRTIVQYGKHASVLNSPLARTLNFMFFPMRYNLKVAGLMANYVTRLSAPMQVAFLHSAMQFSSFLKSSEGQAWYAQHVDAIQLFQYISPLYSLDYLNNILNNPGSISSYGTLGGLPFGFISQGLDAAGITHFNTPYVSSEDGSVIPTYIPANSRGDVNVAIQDLLGQVFTYPGATAGLPSKSSVLKKVATGLTGGSSTDLQPEQTGNLSPQQAAYQKVVEGLHGEAPATMPDGSPFQQYAGPSNPSYMSVDGTSKATVPINPPKPGSTTVKKKKADFTPELLPGQTYLGESP
jgi:hypothetical protein